MAEADDAMRERLAKGLPVYIRDPYRFRLADALLPTVRAIVADELRAAADIPLKACCPEHASKRLRARARELDPR